MKYYKCNTKDCKDNIYLVRYAVDIPNDPSCNECKELYKVTYEDPIQIQEDK